MRQNCKVLSFIQVNSGCSLLELHDVQTNRLAERGDQKYMVHR